MLIDQRLEAFIEATAAAEPVPGGGSVSALAGALAAALSAMVASLSIGRKGYEDSQSEMEKLVAAGKPLRGKLRQGVDRDAMAYESFLSAMKLPKTTADQQAKREKATQAAMREICCVPLWIAQNALSVLDLAGTAVSLGRKDLVSDAAVAVVLARAAVRGSLFNVRFNLRELKDAHYVQETLARVDRMEREVEEKEKALLAAVESVLNA